MFRPPIVAIFAKRDDNIINLHISKFTCCLLLIRLHLTSVRLQELTSQVCWDRKCGNQLYCSPDFRGTGRCESYRLLSDVNISVGNYKTCDILKCVTCQDYSAFSHVVINDHVNECGDVITSALWIHTHNPLRHLGISLRTDVLF